MKLASLISESLGNNRLEKLTSQKLEEYLQMCHAHKTDVAETKANIMALLGMSDKSSYEDTFAESLKEISYKEFKKDDALSPKQKVNNAIIEANRQIRILQRMVTHAQKFKNEMSIGNEEYWTKTNYAIGKITERLIDVATKFKNLR